MSDARPALDVLRQLDHQALLNVRGFSELELEDARSEFYVRLLEGRVRWHGRGSLLSWARTVVRFMALQLRERSWREVLEEPEHQVMSAEKLDVAADRHLLQRLVGRLAPLQRATLELWLAGHTCPEIETEMGLGPRNAESRLQRAQERLRHLAHAGAANSGGRTRGGLSPSGSFLESHAGESDAPAPEGGCPPRAQFS